MDILEAIIQAGRERKLLWIRAREKDGSVEERIIEPYSFRPPGTYERFYCYDIRKQGTRQFYLRNIVEVKILDESFTPRWPVEF